MSSQESENTNMDILYQAAMLFQILDEEDDSDMNWVFPTVHEPRQPDFYEMSLEDIYLYWQEELLLEVEERTYNIVDTLCKSVDEEDDEIDKSSDTS